MVVAVVRVKSAAFTPPLQQTKVAARDSALSLVWFAAVQGIERYQDLTDLTP
jgi:hypothetical protein